MAVAALSAIFFLIWSVGATTSALAVSAPIHISGTGGEGVYIRPETNTSRPAVGWMPEGASPDYNCFAWGQNIGGVPIWFNVNYGGVTGYYASYYDDSSYHSNEELTAKYGVPLCGSSPPSATNPVPAQPPVAAQPPASSPGPTTGSLYFSPYPTNPHGHPTGSIRAADDRSWAYAPSPATVTMHENEWNRDRDREGCPRLSSFTPRGQPAFDSGQISTLAAWSLPRVAPFLFLKGHPEWQSRINYILLLDPGSKGEWSSSKCAQKYDLSKILRDWLQLSPSKRLVIFAGEDTVNAGVKSVDGNGHAGIQDFLFVPLKKQREPPNRNLRRQIVVCSYAHMSHEAVWLRFKREMNQPPVSVSTCPAVPNEKVVGWHP